MQLPSGAATPASGAEGEAPIALRLSGQLMLGVVKVFARKVWKICGCGKVYGCGKYAGVQNVRRMALCLSRCVQRTIGHTFPFDCYALSAAAPEIPKLMSWMHH